LLTNEPKSAQVCLNEAAKVWADAQRDMTAEEIADCEAQSKLTDAKVQMERQNTSFVGDINAYAFLKTNTQQIAEAANAKAAQVAHLNTKYDWYQNATHVFLTFKVVGDKELAKRTKVDFQERSVSLSWEDESLTIPLSNSINHSICESYPFSQKLELKLVKSEANVNWLSLEPGKGVISNA
jgi:hypothetical protein